MKMEITECREMSYRHNEVSADKNNEDFRKCVQI